MCYYHQYASLLVCLSLLSACLSVKGVIQKVLSLRRGGGRVIEKRTKSNRGRGVLACVYVRFF